MRKWIAPICAFAAIVIIGVTIFLLGTDVKKPSDTKPAAAAEAQAPVSLNGHWTADLNDSTMIATVTDDGIEIQWATGNESALYWKGTFRVPNSFGSKFDVVSDADVGAMSSSFLASQDTLKTFTYEHGRLHFTMSAVGITRVVYLTR